jgi:hypothetical protein
VKTDDVTRSSVQKSIVVLSSLPILGSIKSKLGIVTEALFNQKDFTQMDLLDVRLSFNETDPV